uniref:TauD/TfdA-like domain-containing protein n=1 Tax=Amphora coffeiformis TaxID=265554 RepID=A0A7S3LE97_9STRA
MKVHSVSTLLLALDLTLGGAAKIATPRPFRLINEEEAEEVLGNGIAFNHSWLLREHSTQQLKLFPDVLPPPSFVQIYAHESSACMTKNATYCSDLQSLGSVAAVIIDAELDKTGAILFRNLPVHNARQFRDFFQGTKWPTMKYAPYGPNRPQVEGTDLATNIPSQYALGLHNEMAYDPKPASRIAFFCNTPAQVGGETILGYNKELTAILPQEMLDLVRRQGGVLYTRRHFDDAGSLGPDFSQMRLSSWQEKCRGTTKEEAMAFFTDMGFHPGELDFDAEGTLTIRFQHSGFTQENGQDVWFNGIYSGLTTTPDGMPFPSDFSDSLELYYWKAASAFKLQENDWLVLDNKRVMHGRLPYSKQGPDRQLLTVYSA